MLQFKFVTAIELNFLKYIVNKRDGLHTLLSPNLPSAKINKGKRIVIKFWIHK